MTEREFKTYIKDTLNDIVHAIESEDVQRLVDRVQSIESDIEKLNEQDKQLTNGYSAENLKWLYNESGFGMLACKKALYSSGGDVMKALESLRRGDHTRGYI